MNLCGMRQSLLAISHTSPSLSVSTAPRAETKTADRETQSAVG
ncbi:MAG: hypothetical protein Q4F47_00135 [Bacteroidaceae bacterium]|nr:hypothetical protein [Bacteroidaceae bacterium]